MRRAGFALLGVLWTVTLLAGVVAAGTAAARTGQRASANRMALIRGGWAAEACLAIAEARAARDALAEADTTDLGRTVTCTWSMDRPDTRLDLNNVPADALMRLALATGTNEDLAQQFARAVVEARRASAFTDVEQVAGFPGTGPRLLAQLSVDGSGRVDASGADAAVLSSLPGLSPEAVATILRRREFGRPLRSFDELGGALSPAARAALHARYAELVTLLRFESTRLVISAEGWVDTHGRVPSTTIEAVVERLPDRLALLRRRQR